MHGGALEREIRGIEGVVSCAVAQNGVFVLVDEGRDARAIERAVALLAGRHEAGPVQILTPPRAPVLRLAAVRAAVKSSPRARALGIAAASIALLVPLIPMASRVVPAVPPVAVRPAPGSPSVPEVLVDGGTGPSFLRRAAGPAASQQGTAASTGAGPNTVAAGAVVPVVPVPRSDAGDREASPNKPSGGGTDTESCRNGKGNHRGWTEARGEARATHRPDCVPAGSEGGRWR